MSSACSTSEMFCFNVVLNVLYWVSHCGYHCFLTCQTLLNVKCVFYFRDVLFQCRAQCLVLGVALWLLLFLTCQTLLNVKCGFYFRDVLFQCRAQCLVLGVALWLSLFLTCQTLLNVKCVFYFRDVLFQCRAQCLVLGVALWLSLFFNLPNTLKCQVRVLLQRCFVSMSCSMSCIGCRIVVIIVF